MPHILGDAHTTQAANVAGHSTVQRLGDTLAILRVAQFASVVWIGEKGNFRKDRWHIRANQYYKRRLLDAPVFQAWVPILKSGVEALLHVEGELTRFADLVLERDLLYQI